MIVGVKEVGGKENLGLPRVGEDQASGGDKVAVVDVIFSQTMRDT